MKKRTQWTRRRSMATMVIFATAASVILGLTSSAMAAVNPADLEKVEAALPDKPTAKPAKPRKILVINLCHGFRHGSIPLGAATLSLMGEKTGAFTTDDTDDLGTLTPENLAKYDAVCLNNTTRLKITDDQKKALADFVKGGGGLIGIHAASDNFYDWPEGAAMVGGLFNGHPWGGGGTWAVKIDEPDHPLCKGFGGVGFREKEEIYKLKDPYSRENLRVLVSLDMEEGSNRPGREDGDNAISWIQSIEKGRCFYTSFGHNNHIFWNEAILQHMLDGIQYALGDLKCDDTPSASLSKKPTPAPCPPKEQ